MFLKVTKKTNVVMSGERYGFISLVCVCGYEIAREQHLFINFEKLIHCQQPRKMC